MPPARPRFVATVAVVPRLGRVVVRTHDRWLRYQIEHRWGARNAQSIELFRRHPPSLDGRQRTLVDQLRDSGLATERDDLLPDDGVGWADLHRSVSDWLASDAVKRREHAYLTAIDRGSARWKEYILMMSAFRGTPLSWNDSILRLGLRPEVLSVASAYFGMFTRLLQADVWKTLPDRELKLTGSRRWHRDPEDVKTLKVFAYLNDVTEESGPLHYVRYSRPGEQYGDLWPQQFPYGSVAPADAIEAKIPSSAVHVCAYPAGTLIAVDTAGLHMGGRASGRDRLMAVWTFVSASSPWSRTFDVDTRSLPSELSPAARFALYL